MPDKDTSKARPRRLAIVCGGTGGHFYPGLTVAAACNENAGNAVLFVAGHSQSRFMQAASERGIEAIAAPAVGAPRGKLDVPVTAIRMACAVLKCARLLRRHHIDVVLGMGGYTSVATGLAARFCRIPLVLHDGNAVLGRANRLLSRFAELLTLSYPLRNPQTARCPTQLVGMPLRNDLLAAARAPRPREDVYNALGLDKAKRTLLVFGGSQGARIINDMVTNAIGGLSAAADRFQIMHLTGTDDNDPFITAYAAAGVPARVQAYESRMDLVLQAADLCICRAGGSTLAELTLFGVPAIFIPLAIATDAHQLANAQTAANIDGALIIEEADCTPERLRAALTSWLDDSEAFTNRADNLKNNARPDATATLLKCLQDL